MPGQTNTAYITQYRLFYNRAGGCRVRYGDERGKGDHRQVGPNEHRYAFINLETLLADFERDVTNWSTTIIELDRKGSASTPRGQIKGVGPQFLLNDCFRTDSHSAGKNLLRSSTGKGATDKSSA